jgi:hypothetical protein
MITNIANDTTNEIIHLLTDDLHVKIANILSNKIVDILSNILINLDIDVSNNDILNESNSNMSSNDLLNESNSNVSKNDMLNETNSNVSDNVISNNNLLNESNSNVSDNDIVNETINDISDNVILNESNNDLSKNNILNNVILNESNNKIATIVTCYYIVPNKHNNEKYDEWINNFMLLNANRIIYCDKKSHQYMSSKYPEKDNLKYIIKEMEYFYVNKWDWKKEEDNDFEIIRGHNEFLYKIWAEKIYFIKDAIENKIFENDIYCWVDIGSFRDKNRMNDFNDFPLKEKIIKDKINILLINKFKENEMNNIVIDDRFKFVNRLGGNFAGGKDIMLNMSVLYENMLNEFDKVNIFKGKEQIIWNYLYINNPQLFNLTNAIEFNGYDKWFYFHYKWSTDNSSQIKTDNSSLQSQIKEIVTFNIGKKYNVYIDLINQIPLNNNKLNNNQLENRINRKIIKNGKYDFYVINLLNRKDRYDHIINIFKDYDVNLYFIDGFIETVGRIGCNKSHLYAIQYAKKNNLPYIITVEDDFIFNENVSVDEFYNVLDIITTNYDKYDIFNGSPTFWDQRNSMHNVKKYKSFNDDYNLITNGLKATFIVYTQNMYDKMINNFNPNTELYNDQYTAQNFKQLCYKKYLCYELESYSNLQNRLVNNIQYIKSQEDIYNKMKVIE